MACRTIKSPITGKETTSKLWDTIYKEVQDEAIADELYAKTTTPEFLNWFGQWINSPSTSSQVKYDTGEPMMVFHGTTSRVPFDTFDKNKSNGSNAFFFSDNKDYASKVRSNLSLTETPYFLNIRNPVKQDDIGNDVAYDNRNNGDGVIGKDFGQIEGKTYVVYEPNQIKSVFNDGSFSNKPNIYKQLDPNDIKKYNEQVTDSTPKAQKESVERILKLQERVSFSDGQYILDNYKKMKRVSEVVSEQGEYYGFSGDSSEFKDNRAWGDQLDAILSGVILGQELGEIYLQVEHIRSSNTEGSTASMSTEVIDKAYEIFKEFVDNYPDAIIMTQQVFYNEEMKIAGTLDVLAVLPDGHVEIIDLKSSINPTNYNSKSGKFESYEKVGEDGKSYKNRYDKKFKDKASKYERHQAQQSMYKGLLTSKGFEFGEKPLSILPIHISEKNGSEVTGIEVEEQFELEGNQNFVSLTQKDVHHHNTLDISKFNEYDILIDRIKKLLENKRIQLEKQNKPSNASYIQYLNQSISNAEYAKAINTFIDEVYTQFIGNESFNGFESQLESIVKKVYKNETDDNLLSKLHDVKDMVNLYNPVNNNIIRDLMTMYEKAAIIENKEIKEGSPLFRLKEVINSIEKTNRLIDDILPSLQAKILADQLPKNVNTQLTQELERRNKRRLQYIKQGKLKAARRIEEQIIKAGGEINGDEVSIVSVDKDRIEHFLKSGTYKDISFIDAWMTPAISSSNIILATFAKHVKSAFENVRLPMINFVKSSADKFDKFKKATGRNTDNVAKFNEGLYEFININGKKQAAFIQPIDITKFTDSKNKMYESLSEMDKNSKKYKKTVTEWYKDNTQSRPKKDIVLNGEVLIQGIDSIIQEKKDLFGDDSYLYKQWYSQNVIKKDGIKSYIRELAMPNLNTYFNSSFASLFGANPDFNSIQHSLNKSNPKINYYKYLLTEYLKAQKEYPARRSEWDKFVLPAITKSSNDRIRENGMKDYFKYKTKDFYKQLEEDEDVFGDTQSNFKFVPMLYQHKLDASETSLDLVLSVIRFKEASMRYKEQSNLIPLADTLLDKVKSTNPTADNSISIKIIDKAAKNLGIGSWVKYKDKHDGNNVSALLEAFIDMQIYGKQEISHKIKLPVIGEIEMNKVANGLMSFMSKTQIAVNPILSVANSLQARVSLGVEAAAGEFFNKKEWYEAGMEYNKLELNGDFFNEKWNNSYAKTKIGQLIELYDPLQGEYRDRMGRNISRSKLKKLVAWDTPFMLQHKGEHHIQVKGLIALLKKHKVIVNGQSVSLYDAYTLDSDGNLTLPTGAELLNKDIQNRLHAINKRLHGVYNNFDKPQVERYWWGRLMLMYRKFVAPGFKRRYKSLGHDVELSGLTEGYYNTFFGMMFTETSTLMNYLNPFSEENKNLSELEKANIKRSVTELATVALLGVIVMLMKAAKNDDEDNALLNYNLYWAMRLQTEMQFYGMPGDPTQGPLGFFLPDIMDTYRLAKTPTVATTTIEKVFRLIHQLGNPTEEYKRKSGIWDKGDYKLQAQIYKMLGISGNTFSPEQAIKNLELSKI